MCDKHFSEHDTNDFMACLISASTLIPTARVSVQVPTYKLITPAVVSERLKIGGSLARAALRDMASKGMIRPVILHGSQLVYTRSTAADDDEADDA